MAKKQTEAVIGNTENQIEEEIKEIVEEVEAQAGEIEGEPAKGTNLDNLGEPVGITDAVVLGDSIYYVKNNSTLFEKRKDGNLLELFTFPHTESRISIEGFYLGKLVFLMMGKLYSINDRHQLELIAE